MKHVLQVLGCIVMLAVTWLGLELAWTVRQTRPHLEVTLENLDRTIIIAGAAATHLEKASGTWEKSSKEQSIQTTLAMQRVSVAAGQLSSFITGMDKSLNADLFPTLTESIKSQNAALLESEALLNGNLSEMARATERAQKILVDVDSQINNPAIKESVDSLAESSANLAASTKDVKQVLDSFRERYLKAPNMAYAVFKELLAIGSQGVQFFLKK